MRDKRYSIAREYCGRSRAIFVVRFCGAWVGCRWRRSSAERLRDAHAARRHAILTGAA